MKQEVEEISKAGVDIFVAGSAVFNAPDPEAEIEALKSME